MNTLLKAIPKFCTSVPPTIIPQIFCCVAYHLLPNTLIQRSVCSGNNCLLLIITKTALYGYIMDLLQFTTNLLNQDRPCFAMCNVCFKLVSIRHKKAQVDSSVCNFTHMIANCYWCVSIIRGTHVA